MLDKISFFTAGKAEGGPTGPTEPTKGRGGKGGKGGPNEGKGPAGNDKLFYHFPD